MIHAFVLALSTLVLATDRPTVQQHIHTCQSEFENYKTAGFTAVERDCRRASAETHYLAAHMETQANRDYTDTFAAYLGVISAAALADTGQPIEAELRMVNMRKVAQDVISRHVAGVKGLAAAASVVHLVNTLLPKIEKNYGAPPQA